MKLWTLTLLLVATAAFAQTAPPLVSPPPAVISCSTATDCTGGLICTGYQPLADGKWSRGVCQDRRARAAPGEPTGLVRKSANEPERFRFRGTVPEGFHLLSEPRGAFVGGGVGALAGGYAFAALGGLASGELVGLIPVVGPILLGAAWWSTSGWFSGAANVLVAIFCGADLIAQVAGIALLTVGLASPRRWLERDVAGPVVTFVPGAAGAPVGASLVGRF